MLHRSDLPPATSFWTSVRWWMTKRQENQRRSQRNGTRKTTRKKTKCRDYWTLDKPFIFLTKNSINHTHFSCVINTHCSKMTNFVQKSFAQFGRPERNSSDDASGSPQKHLSPKKNPFGGNKIKVSHEPLNRKPSGVVHEQEDEGSSGSTNQTNFQILFTGSLSWTWLTCLCKNKLVMTAYHESHGRYIWTISKGRKRGDALKRNITRIQECSCPLENKQVIPHETNSK